jgi:hypothetical protein
MLHEVLNEDNKLHILPYISEDAMGYDNTPLPRIEQTVFYDTYMPGIQEVLESGYLEDGVKDYSEADKTPDLSKFKTFLASHFNEFRDRGLLLFSHGHVIRSLYKKLNNNSLIRIKRLIFEAYYDKGHSTQTALAKYFNINITSAYFLIREIKQNIKEIQYRYEEC